MLLDKKKKKELKSLVEDISKDYEAEVLLLLREFNNELDTFEEKSKKES